MKSLCFVLICMLCMVTLVACNNVNTNTSIDSTVFSQTEQSMMSQTDCSRIQTETTESVFECVEGLKYYFDFDFDGVNEIAVCEYGLIKEMQIYKKINSEYVAWGDTIKMNSIKPEWLTFKNLSLYYDEIDKKYFYISEYDLWEKEYNSADINKYIITMDGLSEENIAHCEFDYTSVENCIIFKYNTINGIESEQIGEIQFKNVNKYFPDTDMLLPNCQKIYELHFDDDNYTLKAIVSS